MRWSDRQRSRNVEDRRGQGGGSMFGGGRSSGGGGFNFPMGGRMGGGLGLIIVLVLALLFGGGDCLGGLLGGGRQTQDPAPRDDSGIVIPEMGNDEQQDRQSPTFDQSVVGNTVDVNNDDMLVDFLSVVLSETEQTWAGIFEQYGKQYVEPTLVVYEGQTQSACGTGTAQTGPFYCPADQKIYIDVSFFRDLANKYQAAGDFAIAYVLAHEVAHHVQYLLGITQQMEQQRGSVSQTEMNRLTVRLELQADYLAGVWAHDADRQNLLTDGDLEEAMTATAAIGDDRLQKQAQGYVVPDSFTHGTSAQRSNWFMKGYRTGTLAEWDTFSIPYDSLFTPPAYALYSLPTR